MSYNHTPTFDETQRSFDESRFYPSKSLTNCTHHPAQTPHRHPQKTTSRPSTPGRTAGYYTSIISNPLY